MQNCHDRVAGFQQFKHGPFTRAEEIPACFVVMLFSTKLGYCHSLCYDQLTPMDLKAVEKFNPRSPVENVVVRSILQYLVSALHDVEITENGSFFLCYPVGPTLLTKQSCMIYLKIYNQNEQAETRAHNSVDILWCLLWGAEGWEHLQMLKYGC